MATSPTRTGAQTAIDRLDALRSELDQLGWDTRLITDDRPHPALLIRYTAPGAPALAEHIYAVELGSRWFYWWSRACGPDATEAARIITGVMRPPAQPSLSVVGGRSAAAR
jgi:hypothetical protein